MKNMEEILNALLNGEIKSLEYSFIDGKETLKINGEEIKNEEESKIQSLIKEYKENIELLDDCTFVEVIEEVEDIIDIQTLDSLLNQDSFTKDDAELIHGQIQIINTVIHKKLVNKIQDLQELLDRL